MKLVISSSNICSCCSDGNVAQTWSFFVALCGSLELFFFLQQK